MCDIYRVEVVETTPTFSESNSTHEPLTAGQLTSRPAILKILNETGQKFESLAPIVLERFAGHGAVKFFRFDEGAHLLEYIDGPMLESLVTHNQDQAAAQILCDVLTKIHASEGAFPAELQSMERNFRSLFLRCERSDCEAVFLRGQTMARKLIDSETDIRVLHGDLHHQNILKHSQRGWLAIDPQCLIGERAYDYANAFFNPASLGMDRESPRRIAELSQLFSECSGISKKRILEYAFAYGCLSSVWMTDDGYDPNPSIRITLAIEAYLLASS